MHLYSPYVTTHLAEHSPVSISVGANGVVYEVGGTVRSTSPPEKLDPQERRLRRVHRIFHRRCVYCDVETVILRLKRGVAYPHNMATTDHLISRQRGGTRSRYNTALACVTCNRKKDHKSVEEFLTLDAEWLTVRREEARRVNDNGSVL